MPLSWTYRCRRVPGGFQKANLEKLITARLLEGEAILRTVFVESCDGSVGEKCAWVTFKTSSYREPPHFLRLLKKEPDSGDHFSLDEVSPSIQIDRHFSGLTQLYPAPPARDITADVIAVGGLNGDAYGSWQSQKKDFHWLKDGLQSRFPQFRTMTYGYDCKMDSESDFIWQDYTRDLIKSIHAARQSKYERFRPIFFICHSAGGIIATTLLTMTAKSKDEQHEDIFQSVYAFMFFGTPHRGLSTDDWWQMLFDKAEDVEEFYQNHRDHKRTVFIGLLEQKVNGANMREHTTGFKELLGHRKVVSFCEEKLTGKVHRKLPGQKKWELSKDQQTLKVDQNTAFLFADDEEGQDLEARVKANANHSDIVKFDDEENNSFVTVVDRLKVFIGDAQDQILRQAWGTDADAILTWLWGPQNSDYVQYFPNAYTIGTEFFESPEFCLWEKGRFHHLKCQGPEGTGKSYLAYLTAEHLRQDPTSTGTCVVTVFTEHEKLTDEDRATENLNLLRALLKYLLENRSTVKVPIELLLLYEKVSRDKWPLSVAGILEILEHEISRYDRVYFVVDGRDRLQLQTRRDFRDQCKAMLKNTRGKLSVLSLMRDDEESQRMYTYCDECLEYCDLYYTCPLCRDSKTRPVYDICVDCLDAGERSHDKSHRLQPTMEVAKPLLIPAKEIEELIKHDLKLSDSGKELTQEVEDLSIDYPGSSASSIDMYDDEEREQPHYRSWLMTQMREDDTPLSNLPDELAYNSMGNIRLVFDWLRRLKGCLHQADFDEIRKDFENNIDSTYYREMEELKQGDQRNQSALAIFALVFISKRRLHIDHLRTALAALTVRSNQGSVTLKQATVSRADVTFLTHGLLDVSKDKEMAVRYPCSMPLPAPGQSWARFFDNPHCRMAEACLSFLGQDVFRRPLLDFMRSPIRREPFLSYASCHWAYHMRESFGEDESAAKLLEKEACTLIGDSIWFKNYCQAWWYSSFKELNGVVDVPSGLHALHVCALLGLDNLIEHFHHSVDIDVLDQGTGQTPLMYACRHGNLDTARRLLDFQAKTKLVSKLGRTPLIESICQQRTHDDDKLTELLLSRGIDVNIDAQHEKNMKRTALMHAAQSGFAKTVRLLLQAGANAKLCDCHGLTALMLAAQQEDSIGDYLDTIKALIEHGGSEIVDFYGSEWRYKTTALHMAILGRDARVIDLLFDSGADGFCLDVWGLDVLSKAMAESCVDRVRQTIRRRLKADKNKDEKTLFYPSEIAVQYPLHVAIEQACRKFGQVDNVQELGKGLDVNGRDCFGLTAMDVALYPFPFLEHPQHYPAISFLLDNEADFSLNCVESPEQLLFEAIKSGHERAVRRLIDAGADLTRLTQHQFLNNHEKKPIDELVQLSDHREELLSLVQEAVASPNLC